MRTSPVLSSVKDSLSSYFVYRAPLLGRGGSEKNFIRNPPPLFFESEDFVLKSSLAINLGSEKPTTDGCCCTHRSYLLDVVTRSNPFNWSPPREASDPSSFQLHQTALSLRRFPLLSTILCPWLITPLLQLPNSFPFTLSLYSYLTYHHLILPSGY